MLKRHLCQKVACFYYLDIFLHVTKRYFSLLKNSVDYRSFQVFKSLTISFTIFTLLDILVTRVGLGVGCVELNQFVTDSGLGLWTLFRVGLLVYLLVMFCAGYRLCKYRFSRILPVLNTSLAILNIYIGVIVFSGIFSIFSKLFF